NRLIRCVCGKKIGPDPRNFNQRVSLGRNDLLIRTFPNAIERPLLPRQDPPFNRLRRCINCACRSVSDAQTKVIYAFSIGLSPHEVAAALNISPKTIHSHKKNIMSKFNLNSRQQFNNLVQLLAKR
ncbi:helix-turn-helix transcriptional regulator, partial [Klebsiella pneumoniae]|uniref:helix-turn-helix transcriptional regulator n=3 Tax=Klebsiella pneumoniae TaxID=573 RepID=UPI00385188CE